MRDSETPRRPYEKPSVLPVSLVAEEVLATGCKLTDMGGGPVIPVCSATPCFNMGTS